jgi:hypothetical protein
MRRVRFAQAFILIATLLGGGLCAAAERPDSPIVLHATRILKIDTGEIVSPGEVLVEGAQIVAVGSSVPHPPGARVLDLGDTTFSPSSSISPSMRRRRRMPRVSGAFLTMKSRIQQIAAGIAVPGNPLDDIAVLQHVVFVMKSGRRGSRQWIDDEVLMDLELRLFTHLVQR